MPAYYPIKIFLKKKKKKMLTYFDLSHRIRRRRRSPPHPRNEMVWVSLDQLNK
jgi:hypothetical protein